MISDIINSIKAENLDERFLHLVQSLFSSKHGINKSEYINLIGPYKLKNAFDQFLIEAEVTLLSDLVFNFDSYLDKEIRNQTGSYYTPPELAEAMVRRSLADYLIKNKILDLSQCEALLFNKTSRLLTAEKERLIRALSQVKIIDIASGTGIFLFKTLTVIMDVYALLNIVVDSKAVSKQLFALDLQSKPLEIYILIIYDYLLESGCSLGNLPKLNISCQDTLMDPISFDRKFDLVLGNPPYVGEKGNKTLFDKYKSLPHLKKYYEGRMDLFYFFIYRGHEILKDKGILTYITTNYFITADGANKLRKYLKNSTYFYRLINFDECKLFSEAKGMHNLIFTLSNTNVDKIEVHYINKLKSHFNEFDIYKAKYRIDKGMIFSEEGNIIVYESDKYFKIIDKIISKSQYRLEDIASVNQGIVSGADRVTKSMLNKKIKKDPHLKDKITLDEAIFVHEKHTDLASKYFKPFFKNSDIEAYLVKKDTNKKILYINDKDLLCEHDVEWQYLMKYYQVLSSRREVQRGTRKWYALQWGRNSDLFENEKIVAPQRSISNKFAYSKEVFYSSADIYYITKTRMDIKYLLALLNSKLMYFWLYNRGKRKGKYLELYAKPISQIPIANMRKGSVEVLIEYIDKILDGDKNSIGAIDDIIYEFYAITNDEKKLIENLYEENVCQKIKSI